MAKREGTVIQIVGPVLDIRFADDQLPEMLSAIEIPHGDHTIVAEVAQHIGDNVARCIAMSSTDGLQRGVTAIDTGAPISVPVGEACLGRVFNLLGQPIDEKDAPEAEERWPIHSGIATPACGLVRNDTLTEGVEFYVQKYRNCDPDHGSCS